MTRLSTHDEFRRERYFPFIDGLRTIAVAFVLLEHARGHAVWRWIAGGTNGVTIFFVISGFLITTLCLREEERRGALDVKGFFIRRAFRILPLYLLMLGVYYILEMRLGLDPGRQRTFAWALKWYASPLPEIPHFTHPSMPMGVVWSLGIEEKFYFVWPLLAFVAIRGNLRRRLAIALGLGGALTFFYAVAGQGMWTFQYVHILWGCVAALVLHRRAWFERARPLGRPAVMLAALALVVALHVLGYLVPPWAMVLYSGSVAVLLVGMLESRPRAVAVIGSRPLVAVGRLTYAIYLTHQLCLKFAERLVPASLGVAGDAATIVIGAALALGVSFVLHVTVERPLIRLGRTLSRRTGAPWPAVQASPVPAAAAAE